MALVRGGTKLNQERPQGITPSERYLHRLCHQSFLSLWSYSNLYTDEGRKNGKGPGHELCDLLVVFGNDVIIFSDKYVEFNRSIKTEVAWKRWFRKAVQKSADQLYRAESWLRKYPDRIYLDPQCQKPFPISLPSPENMRVHRAAVALGVYEACREYFGGNGLGSLIVHSGLEGDDHYSTPFHIGHVNRSKGFVHVFEDFTLNAVLKERDTIADFIAYLSKRELFLSKVKPTVVAAGDEQLLSIYLTHMNSEGEHDFVFENSGEDLIFFDESFWNNMVYDDQYIEKKKADEISYSWDALIEHFAKYSSADNFMLEHVLRHMASETRLRRRQLAHALVDLFQNTPKNKNAMRLFYSNDLPEKAYIFILFFRDKDTDYRTYRDRRQALLLDYCKVVKVVCQEVNYIIGIATEAIGAKASTEDLMALDVRDWTPEMQEEAEQIQRGAGLLLEKNVKRTEGRDYEWPEDAKKANKGDGH